jgi:multiple sugar transport system permease protein
MMLIFLAGLQGIPADLYEAAIVDGADTWQQLRYITIPLISSTTFFVLTTALIGSFQAFTQFYLMTKGGPAFATTTLVLRIYNSGFMQWKMGYAAGMAFLLFLIIFAFTFVQWRLARLWVYGFEAA